LILNPDSVAPVWKLRENAAHSLWIPGENMKTKLPAAMITTLILIAVGTTDVYARILETPPMQARAVGTTVSVWDGVYTGAQAARGKPQYEANCGRCHGADLSGGTGQPLKGEFMRFWEGYPLNSLFSRIKYTMPSGAAGSLSDTVYVDIVAYVLEMSSFPAGREELKLDLLENVRIEGKEGPQPIPNYALVRVVGCLAPAASDTWTLTNATDPVRTRDPEASRDEERKNSLTKPSGPRQFPLRSIYPPPAPFRGHKVEVKGFWIQGSNQHINVNSLQTLSPSCAK
jgi:mono/diheme cytochrome c family protein